jgi:sucrose-6-phosphate hydrolase SacC (GH32 family)
MKWVKRGFIHSLPDSLTRTNHMQVPTVILREHSIRIYYAGRKNGMAYPAYIDIGRKSFLHDKIHIEKHHESTVMEIGNPGMFDSDGIMPSCIVENNGELWMYYIGWNEKTKTARYHNAIGLAVSTDGGETFKRKFQGPIIDRTKDEPGLAVMPYVMFKNWWRMWYQSGTSWRLVGDKYEPVYVIKYADSTDGINWSRREETCVPIGSLSEAFSRPSVFFQNNSYHMYYCYRDSVDYRGGKGSYRMGYAVSGDGRSFKRKDEDSGFENTPLVARKKYEASTDWDNEMQAYPYITTIDGRQIMFYNGNGFGQSGIGYCVWE